MLSLLPPPPLPPPPPPPPQHPPSPSPNQTTFPVSLNQILIAKKAKNQESSVAAEISYSDTLQLSSKPILFHHPRPHRTNILIWCGAILCLIFSLLIFCGIATLIIYLVIKPTTPLFVTPAANLNTVYFDSPEYFNGDLTFLANFSNPNHRLDVRFEYVDIELYFAHRPIGTQALLPFTQRRRETRLQSVHIISSLVYLPPQLAVELQKQMQGNKINYNLRGTFKVTAYLGLLHYSYWLHGRCEIQMTGATNWCYCRPSVQNKEMKQQKFYSHYICISKLLISHAVYQA